MGFISNIAGTLSESVVSELKDQYLEIYATDSLGQDTLVKRAHRINTQGRNKGNVDVISAGSKIIVPEGTYALMTDGGKVVDCVTQAGLYTWENSSSGSVLSGGAGSVLGDVFDRFKFGGEITKIQKIYFINGLEIMNQACNEYIHVPYPDPFYGYLNFKFKIVFSFRIVDPVKFFKLTGKDTSVYDLMGSPSSPKMPFMEVQDHMQEALNLCAVRDRMPFPLLLANKSKVKDAVNEIISKQWSDLRGMTLESVALVDLTLDEESKRRVSQFQTSKIYADNPEALRTLAAMGITDAVKAAGSNPSGAFSGFAGVGMAAAVANNIVKTNPETCPFCGTPLPSQPPLEYCTACCADLRPQ